jgi:hypothetical protein
MGVYGRNNSEGICERDHYDPKHFFSFFRAQDLVSQLEPYFSVRSFRVLPHSDDLDFQSVILQHPSFEESL